MLLILLGTRHVFEIALFAMTYTSAEDQRLIRMWRKTDEAKRLRREASDARKRMRTRAALDKGIAFAQRLAREQAAEDLAAQSTESEGGGEAAAVPSSSGAAVQSACGAGAPQYEVDSNASDASSGRASPVPSEHPSTPPVVAMLQHQAPFQARAWSSMGADLMVRLEQVAIRMRGQRDGNPSTRPVDVCELHIAWDRMARNVDCREPGCLFDTGGVSSEDDE